MKPSPRIILGAVASAAVLLTFLFTTNFFSKNDSSYLLLTSEENRFNLKFFIQENDRDTINTLLAKLNIPQDVQDGVRFQLDSTSSARLAFITPIKANLKLTDKTVSLSGETSIPAISNQLDIVKIKVPKTTNLAIFAPNLGRFVKARLNVPENISGWFDRNLDSSQGSYLVLYGSNADFSLIFKNSQISFEEPKNIKNSSGEPIYKEETGSDANFHLLQIPSIDPQNQSPQTLTFFTLGDYLVMSSSPDAAKVFIGSQKESDSIEFPKSQNTPKASMVMEYLNTDDNPAPELLAEFLLQNWQGTSRPKSKLAGSLKNIQDATFTLKAQAFSGLINLK
ncbi:MAG: hypothetical protein UT84_C0011G0006 [Candidatus Curtissbacteria bacterium GW2011_GWA1_40_16]|uniref:Uncharacterized protein n=1 Tax=Candidatus Curtissbacteria bacterium GW2011_GWA1_40_16 TaxID=1618405 RepID=A0A0G0TTR7_9BACT|nr:MAG: hypothetical protein UT84_C0011G0006 [Candidatus Curtissbacteria bacterium GW2011_GWA1_40_16]